jgi:hypothetical protein
MHLVKQCKFMCFLYMCLLIFFFFLGFIIIDLNLGGAICITIDIKVSPIAQQVVSRQN